MRLGADLDRRINGIIGCMRAAGRGLAVNETDSPERVAVIEFEDQVRGGDRVGAGASINPSTGG